MASENIWAVAAQESPGATISKLQIERWAKESDEAILGLLNAKISTMLEGIHDATERQAATQIRAALVNKRKAVAHRSMARSTRKYSAQGAEIAKNSCFCPATREGGRQNRCRILKARKARGLTPPSGSKSLVMRSPVSAQLRPAGDSSD